MAELSNKEKMERLTRAYEEGRITKDQYLKNVSKFSAEETIPEPPAEVKPEPPKPIIPVEEPRSEKETEIARYVDRLIALGIKHPSRKEDLIIHYMLFDEKQMQKEIEFNGVNTDLMRFFVEKDDADEPGKVDDVNEIEEMAEPVQTQPVGHLITEEDMDRVEPNPFISVPCKSCGHETHGKVSCNRCGSDQIHRVSQRKLMAISCVLLLIGAAYIGAAGAFSETDIAVIGELMETDNFRQIRIVGKVIDLVNFYPEKYSDTGTIRLLVNDGTGNMYVKIMPGITEHFIATGYIPAFGDIVDCEGSLFVGDDGYMQIKIRDKSLFRIRERTYTEITIADLVPPDRSDFDIGEQVIVSGQIQGNFYIDGFARILDLVDDEGRSVSIFIPDVIGQMTVELDLESVYLSHVTVKGALEWYESSQEWEIIPANNTDIVVTGGYEEDTYTTITVAQLLADAASYSGDYIELHDASVTWIYGNGDWLFSVSDASTQNDIAVIVDSGANATVPFHVGDVVDLRGVIIPYQDEYEIKIRAMSSDYCLISGGD